MSHFVSPEIDEDDFEVKSIQNWRARYYERLGKNGVNSCLSKTTKPSPKAKAKYVNQKTKNRESKPICRKHSTMHSNQKAKSPSHQPIVDSGISVTLSGGSDHSNYVNKFELEVEVGAGNQPSPVNHGPLNSTAPLEWDDTERVLTEKGKRVLSSASLAADESLQPTHCEPPSAIESRKTTGSTLKTLHTGDKRKYGDTGSFVVPRKKQASLLSFLSSPKQCREEVKNADCSTSSMCGKTSTSSIRGKTTTSTLSSKKSGSVNESAHDDAAGYSQVSKVPFHGAQHDRVFNRHPSRTCPFYKKVPGEILFCTRQYCYKFHYMLYHCWKEYSLIPRPSVRPPVTQLCVPYRGSENETMERGFSIINFCRRFN